MKLFYVVMKVKQGSATCVVAAESREDVPDVLKNSWGLFQNHPIETVIELRPNDFMQSQVISGDWYVELKYRL